MDVSDDMLGAEDELDDIIEGLENADLVVGEDGHLRPLLAAAIQEPLDVAAPQFADALGDAAEDDDAEAVSHVTLWLLRS